MKKYDIDLDPGFAARFHEARLDLEQMLDEDYAPHLERNSKLCKLLLCLRQYKRYEKVFNCGNYTSWAFPSDFSEKPFIVHANFCKDRLCSMCSWRRSLKVFSQVSQVMNEIRDDYRYIFVTLTLRNVPSAELTNGLDHLNQAFHLFHTYSKVRKAFKGYFKALEITRNKESEWKEWHHHLHIIYAVNQSYFDDGKQYISHKELKELWQRALGADYYPYVRIQTVKGSKTDDGFIDMGKALAEVTKYVLKDEDVFTGSIETQCRSVLTLTDALKGRRLCSFGGIFKQVARKLKLEDLEDGDLTDQDKLRSDVHYLVVNCSWTVGYGFHYSVDKTIYTDLKRRKRK